MFAEDQGVGISGLVHHISTYHFVSGYYSNTHTHISSFYL